MDPEDSSARGYSEKWKETYDWAERSPLGDEYTFCSICNYSLNTVHKGIFDLRRHTETIRHKKGAESLQRAGPKRRQPLPCSSAAVRLINRHCSPGFADGDKVSRNFARCKLGLNYPKDIMAACLGTPYCLYVCGGLSPGKDDGVSIILVGFFDVDASRRRLRFLDALQSADQTVVEAVKKFGLPSENLAACYSQGCGAASEWIRSQLRELNPSVVAVTGLYALADAACHAGLEKLSEARFGSDASIQLHPTSCLKLFLSAQTALEKWTNPAQSSEPGEWSPDARVGATLQFLVQALKPLHTFQSRLESQADIADVLEGASGLLSTYTSFFLHPEAAERFIKERDAKTLKDPTSHLETLELGGKVVEYFLKESKAADSFREEVLDFYVAVTEQVSEMLPLSVEALRSAARLLDPRRRADLTEAAVRELGAALGICSSTDELEQLAREFLACQGAMNGEEEEEEEMVSIEKHWAEVLKDTKATSPLRKLVLTLLSLPRPPLDPQQLLTQVCKHRRLILLSGCCFLIAHAAFFPSQSLENDDAEHAAFTESESDILSDGGLSENASARYASLLQQRKAKDRHSAHIRH